MKDEIAEKRTNLKKKEVLFHQDNAPYHKSMKTMAMNWISNPHPPYSPDLAPSDFFLFSNLKRMLAGKKFSADEEVIAETEAYFEAKDKLYYKNGVEKLYDPIIAVSPLKATILNNKIKLHQRTFIFYVSLRTFQPTCYI